MITIDVPHLAERDKNSRKHNARKHIEHDIQYQAPEN